MKRKVFTEKAAELCERFTGRIPSVLTFEDPEDLHQLRVTGRSLLACLSLMPKKERGRSEHAALQKEIRKQMALLGKLRDLDVLLGEIDRRLGTSPKQVKLLAAWKADLLLERSRTRAAAAEALPDLSDPRFSRKLAGWQERLRKMTGFAPNRRVKKLREQYLQTQSSIVFPDTGQPEWFSTLDDTFLESLHATRIKAKKLRYALALPGGEAGEIDRLKVLQDRLGIIQDRRVWLSRLEQYRAIYPTAADQLAETFKAEMGKAIAEVADKRN